MSVEQSFSEARKAHFERAKQIKVDAIVELAETMTFEELFKVAARLKEMAESKLDTHLRATSGSGNE